MLTLEHRSNAGFDNLEQSNAGAVVITDDIIEDAIKEFHEGPEQSGWWLEPENDQFGRDDEEEIQADSEESDEDKSDFEY